MVRGIFGTRKKNDELRMTNGEIESLEDCQAEELAFWGFDIPAGEMVLRDEPAAQIYDLEERTSRFGEQIVLFAKKIPWSPVNNRLIDQLVGAGTSVGANYCEADDGVSRADFKHKIAISRKESRETKFFLRMVATAEPKLKSEAREIWREAHSLHRIFSRIWRSTNTVQK
jgi:four helix bundle protein